MTTSKVLLSTATILQGSATTEPIRWFVWDGSTSPKQLMAFVDERLVRGPANSTPAAARRSSSIVTDVPADLLEQSVLKRSGLTYKEMYAQSRDGTANSRRKFFRIPAALTWPEVKQLVEDSNLWRINHVQSPLPAVRKQRTGSKVSFEERPRTHIANDVHVSPPRRSDKAREETAEHESRNISIEGMSFLSRKIEHRRVPQPEPCNPPSIMKALQFSELDETSYLVELLVPLEVKHM
jgi:hypothetical protein